MKSLSARLCAENYIEQHFCNSAAVFLAGSVIRKQETPTSDLDIVVVMPTLKRAYRQSVVANEWPIELFVHSLETLHYFFNNNIASRAPSIVQMCAEGEILINQDHLASSIQSDAQTLLKQGPPPLKPQEKESYRYTISDLLEDLKGNQSHAENPFIVSQLVNQTLSYLLAINNHWIGTGKWLFRHLNDFDPGLASVWTQAIDEAYSGAPALLIKEVERVLNQHGGYLFAGYFSEAPELPPKNAQ